MDDKQVVKHLMRAAMMARVRVRSLQLEDDHIIVHVDATDVPEGGTCRLVQRAAFDADLAATSAFVESAQPLPDRPSLFSTLWRQFHDARLAFDAFKERRWRP